MFHGILDDGQRGTELVCDMGEEIDPELGNLVVDGQLLMETDTFPQVVVDIAGCEGHQHQVDDPCPPTAVPWMADRNLHYDLLALVSVGINGSEVKGIGARAEVIITDMIPGSIGFPGRLKGFQVILITGCPCLGKIKIRKMDGQ